MIFDANYQGTAQHHGFNEKLAYLEERKRELNITFEVFLSLTMVVMGN